MEKALENDGQVMLLLNRRGFHTFILCPQCGGVVKCDACDVALTFHKERRLALCHMCDFEREPPETCPTCAAKCLHYGGIGTERLEREVKASFADRVVRRMDSDTMRSPGSHERVLESFRNGQIDILLGTQMIAKGLDFPNVTLVGVVNADTSLHLPDFRAESALFSSSRKSPAEPVAAIGREKFWCRRIHPNIRQFNARLGTITKGSRRLNFLVVKRPACLRSVVWRV